MKRAGSEIFHGRLLATSALVASAMLASSAAVAGGPTGGSVAVGSATITSPSSNQTVVNQSSQKALINWNSFSVSSGSTVQFVQPNKKSLTVNRVTGPNASAIDGQLLANGNIWLINANGIMFGHGAQVNVGALLATTSDISDDDFRKGRYRFSKPSSNPNAGVDNQGHIEASNGGSVVLSGAHVSNEGVIQANLGTVVLGGAQAFTVDMHGDNLLRYQVTKPVTTAPKDEKGNIASALVSNSGTIEAAGGRVLMTARAARNVQDNVVNNTGMIEATSVSSHNGEIDLDAGPDGTVNAGGTIDASGKGAGQTGGTINLAGQTVNVTNGAKVDASGDQGGGTIQIGGGFRGKGTILNSQTTNIGNAVVTADAISNGNGGKIAIWSNGTTTVAGTISAQGGAHGGDGGYVETSGGHLNVGASATVNTSAAMGLTGDWLLDPEDIDIVTGGQDGINGSNIDPNTIIRALGTSNVTLEATNNITIDSDLDYSSKNSLNLLAGHDVIANADLLNSGTGDITLLAGWDGTTTDPAQFANAGVYGNNGGSVLIGEGNDSDVVFTSGGSTNVSVGSADGSVFVEGFNVTLKSENGTAQIGFSGGGGTGDIFVQAVGDVDLDAISAFAQIGNGGAGATGSNSGDITVTAQGNVDLVTSGTSTIAAIGSIEGDGSSEASNIAVTSGGHVSLITDGTDSVSAIGNIGGDASTQTGEITVSTTGSLSLLANTTGAAAQIGNFIVNGPMRTANPGNASGDIAVNASAISLDTEGQGTNAAIGNGFGGFYNNDDVTGNISITTGNLSLISAGTDMGRGASRIGDNAFGDATVAININAHNISFSAGDYGNTIIGTGTPNGIANGDITIMATGFIDMEGSGQNSQARIGEGGLNTTSDILVESVGTITLDASGNQSASYISNFGAGTVGGNVTVEASDGNIVANANGDSSFVQIGLQGTDSTAVINGNVVISANGTGDGAGNIAISASGADSLAQFGNGLGQYVSADGDINLTANGNISVATPGSGAGTLIGDGAFASGDGVGSAAGNISISAGNIFEVDDSDQSTIGNSGGPETGDVTIDAFDFASDGASQTIGFGNSIATDLAGGNVTLEVTDSESNTSLQGTGSYSSSNTLEVLASGSLIVDSSIQNAGSGDIILVAGWDGVTTGSVADLEEADAYGKSAGLTITVGGAGASNVAVGSASGTTTALTGGLIVDAENGYAQLGYHGGATGEIDVVTTGDVTLTGNSAGNFIAQIGSGGADVTDAVDSKIVILTGGAGVNMEADGDDAVSQIGNMGTAATLQSGEIIINTNGNAINLASSGSSSYAQIGDGSAYGDATNGNVALTVGAISASGKSIVTGDAADIDTSAGGTGGSVGSASDPLQVAVNDLSITTAGADAFINSTRSVSIGDGDSGIDLNGGNLTLSASGSISQTQAILANSIDVTSTGGDITLTDTANDFVSASVTTPKNASITDSTDLSIAGANVGGVLALTTPGTLSQTGPITAGELDATAATIALNNPDNMIGSFGVNTTGDFTLSSAEGLDVGTSSVGGTLTLIAGGDIDQTGAITAGTVDASTTDGAINLTNTGNKIANANLSATNGATLYDASDVNFMGGTVNGGLTMLDTGNITFTSSAQLTSGNVLVVAGWDGKTTDPADLTQGTAYGNNGGSIFVGGSGADGDVAVGSETGSTTFAGANVSVDGENGYAQVGYHGNGSGDVSVYAQDTVTVADNSAGGFTAQIGNGGTDVSGDIGGDISVNTNDGAIIVAALGDNSVAEIGNLGGAASNESGNISIDTNGGALQFISDGSFSYSQAGNWARESNTGTSTGDISVNVGALTMASTGAFSFSQIGNGEFEGPQDSGDISGNITVNASSITLAASAPAAGNLDESRIGNLGEGNVTGSLSVATTGDIVLAANGQSVASIGNFSSPFTNNTSSQGLGTGSVTVNAGGSISMSSDGAGAYTSIEFGGAEHDVSVSVTANGNITETASDGAGALIGTLVYGNGGGDITVTSLNGNVDAEAIGDGSFTEIGNNSYSLAGNLFGDVDVTAANGNIIFGATSGTNTLSIGNVGIDGGTTSGDISITTGGMLELAGGSQTIIGDKTGTTSGDVTISATSLTGDINPSIANDLPGGDFTLDLTGDSALTIASDQNYDSSHTLTIDNGGDIILAGSIQNSGAGDITINAGGDITIGGESATGNVAVGSADGTTTISGANVNVDGENGYAQIGYHGAGSGDIDVVATSDITLSGGAKAAYFAQIGDGGYQVTASNSGNIAITAAGNLTLNAGAGQEAYAQIGHGGAESNTGTDGYSNTGSITVGAATVALNAGSGSGSYAQIGHGGYKAGQNLASGKAVNEGDITLNVVSSVTMKGNGTDAYAQIGNGGDQVNSGAANGTSGTTGGDIAIDVTSPIAGTDPIVAMAGTGNDSYVQIGNGGYDENAPATGATVSFVVSGDLDISDLTLQGSDTGTNGYAQLGNGDTSKAGTGDVSGDITIAGTSITLINGTALGASAQIGNATGFGTVTGTVTGYNGGGGTTPIINQPGTIGAIASIQQTPTTPTDTSILISTVEPLDASDQSTPLTDNAPPAPPPPTPLQQLADLNAGQTVDAEGTEPSDDLVDTITDSLDENGGHKGPQTVSRTLIPGVLTQVVTVGPRSPNGVPPADEDYSSWGNESLWQW